MELTITKVSKGEGPDDFGESQVDGGQTTALPALNHDLYVNRISQTQLSDDKHTDSIVSSKQVLYQTQSAAFLGKNSSKKKNPVSLDLLAELDMIREQGGHSVKDIELFKQRLLEARNRKKMSDHNELMARNSHMYNRILKVYT